MRFSIPTLKTLSGLAGAAVLALLAVPANAGTITGSAHDFSGAGWSGNQICVACHTPHNADTGVAEAPLWNHTVTTTTFDMYSSATLDAAQSGQPSASSRLCLSCHDGTVAVDSFGGLPGSIFLSGNAAVGAATPSSGTNGDLSDDHPISITYNDALAGTDPGLHVPSTTVVQIGTGGTRTRDGTIATNMLIGGEVQCASCHDVHNTFTVPAVLGGDPLLKVSKTNSAICLTCHNK